MLVFPPFFMTFLYSCLSSLFLALNFVLRALHWFSETIIQHMWSSFTLSASSKCLRIEHSAVCSFEVMHGAPVAIELKGIWKLNIWQNKTIPPSERGELQSKHQLTRKAGISAYFSDIIIIEKYLSYISLININEFIHWNLFKNNLL